MAYVTYYRIIFTNSLMEEVEILLQKKDGDPDTIPQDYVARSARITANTEGGDELFAPVIGRQLEITFAVLPTDLDYWAAFTNAEHDEWYVIATVNLQLVFQGFVMQDDGAIPFMDPPIDAKITATDGLGLLKNEKLVNIDGTEFRGEYTLIEYVAGAIKRTGNNLPIRIYDDLVHESHIDRDNDPKYDSFGQTKLDYRTFQKNATEFINCYEALEIILSRGYRLFYWNGEFVIYRIGLYQYVPFVLYYTVYDSNGQNPVGYIEQENYATVGKAELIRPINNDQIQSVAFAMKEVRTFFSYNPWPEIPKNGKLNRGEPSSGEHVPQPDDIDEDGDGDFTEIIGYYVRYPVLDWTSGKANYNAAPNFALDPAGIGSPYIKRIYNTYDVETRRELVLFHSPTTNSFDGEVWLLSDAIPVMVGDRISFSVDKRTTSNVDPPGTEDLTDRVAMIYIVTESGSWYFLNGLEGDTKGRWYDSSFFMSDPFSFQGFITVKYAGDTRKYAGVQIDSQSIPVNGTMYVALINTSTTEAQFFRNIELTYKPFVAGSFEQVKGDSWTREQNKSFPDKADNEVFISDVRHKSLKGCLLTNAGLPTTPAWHRHGITERRHYKEIINLSEFNLLYRRFWSIAGSFRSTTYEPQNNQTNHIPIGMHKLYRFVDIPGENRQFILLCPFEMDLITGFLRATFAEVLVADTTYVDQIESFDVFRAKIISAINNTTQAEWNSAGLAPSVQTGFPPIAYVFPDATQVAGVDRAIGIIINQNDEMDVLGPGISKVYDQVITNSGNTWRWIIFQFASEVLHVGDNYTFSAYGHDVNVTVGTISTADQDDGKKLGDSSDFDYFFD